MQTSSLFVKCLVVFGLAHSIESYAADMPMDIVIEAAQAALQTCRKDGFSVTVTVVNANGLIQAQLKGDNTGPHTLDSSKYKAYTAASIAPIVNMDTTSEIAKRILSTPGSSQLANLPNILLVGGGIAIRSGGKVIGALGVGGAPGADLDEACAKAGIDKIRDRLP